MNFRLPVAYYFTKGRIGNELAQWLRTFLRNIKDADFRVTRIVTDNHITNIKMFGVLSGNTVPKPVISHPTDASRILFHIIKKILKHSFKKL